LARSIVGDSGLPKGSADNRETFVAEENGAMCRHSLGYAEKRGFRGMQFNFPVGTNTPAVALWQGFGFEIIGHLPLAFHRSKLGFVDAMVMFRPLDGSGAWFTWRT
jgi:hypothetical protein